MILAAILGAFSFLISADSSALLREASWRAAQTQDASAQTNSTPAAQPSGEQSDKASDKGSSSTPSSTKPAATSGMPNAQTPKVAAKKTAPKKHRAKPNASVEKPDAQKVVIKNGGTAEPAVQLAPHLSDEKASHQRQDTDGLLSTTDSNLKQVCSKPLNSTQQDTVTQIHSYVQQAKQASKAGELERAHNLALKAHLLSDDLVGH